MDGLHSYLEASVSCHGNASWEMTWFHGDHEVWDDDQYLLVDSAAKLSLPGFSDGWRYVCYTAL